jgi:hypothetical protein
MRPGFHVFEGGLWKETTFPSSRRLIRERYSVHVRDILSTLDVRASLRAGAHTSVGGYATAFYTSDGGTLCHACVRTEYRQVSNAIRHKLKDGWHVAHLDAECNSGSRTTCEHCNAVIWEGADDNDDDSEG